MRYLVDDVSRAVDLYVGQLGFDEQERWGPATAIVARDDLRLWLADPASSAAKPTPDGRRPEPGGWNRIVLEVGDLDAVMSALRASGAAFRNEPISGPGDRQVLMEDPAGNVVEMFQFV